MSKYIVPEGMLKAARSAWNRSITRQERTPGDITILEAALLWLSKNPMCPTHAEVESILAMVQFQSLRGTSLDGLQDFAAMWQRRCFLAPEPEVPEAIKSLIFPTPQGIPVVIADNSVTVQVEVNNRILEAYRRGKESSKQ